MQTLIYLLLLIFKTYTLYSISPTATTLSSYTTLQPAVSYSLTFSITSQTITASSYVTLTFSYKYEITIGTLAGCKATQSSSVAAAPVSCQVTNNTAAQTYSVKFTGIYPSTITATYLQLQFTITNPYAQTTETISVNILDSSNNVQGLGSVFIAFTATALTSCSISSSSQVTGYNSTHTFRFTPIRKMFTSSFLIINMPLWSGTTSNKASTTLTCNGISGTDASLLPCGIDTGSTTENMNISGFITSDRTSPTSIEITVATLRNPWSLQPFGPIDIQLYKGSDLTQRCNNNYHTVSEPNGFVGLSFILATNAIKATNTNVRLIFQDINPFPKTSENRVKIDFPSEVEITYSGSVTSSKEGQTYIFKNVTSVSIQAFTFVTPPSTRPYQLTVSTYVVVSGVEYIIDRGSLSYQNNAGTITNVQVTPANLFVNEITTYTIKFTIANQLISGSFIDIVFPADINMDLVNSVCSLSIAGHICSLNSANNLTIDVASTINAATEIIAIITLTQNTDEAKSTDSFKFYSYYENAQYDTLVDKLQSGVIVTMTANTLASGLVEPTSYETYALTSYTFIIELNDPIPAGGSIQILFPITTSLEGSTLQSASFATGTCSINEPVDNTLQITGCFSAPMTDLSVNIVISKVRNPPSLKPTDTFKFYSKGVSSTINYMDIGMTVEMTTATDISSVNIIPDSLIVNDNAIYRITIDQTITIHQANDYLQLSIPSLMTLPSSPICTLISGPSFTCLRVSNTKIRFTYTSQPAGTGLSIDVEQITNYLIGDQPATFKLEIYNSAGYLMQKYTSFQITYTQSILTTVTVNNDDNIALGEASNVTLTISNSFSLYNSLDITKTKLVISIPLGFTAAGSCVSTQGICSLSGVQYQVTNIGKTLTNVKVTLLGIILSYFEPASESFQLVYTYDGFNVSVEDTGVVVIPYCQSPCQRCDSTPTACQSCLPLPNTKEFYDPVLLNCLTQCPDGKYPNQVNECTPCVPPCAFCDDVENCTSCVSGTWLFDSQCLLVCPDQYYNDSSGQCLPCQSPCDLCNSLSSCQTCLTLYITGNQCVDASDCPAKTFANSSSMQCQPCLFPCFNCSLNPSNCTTCETGYLYYDNICTQSCPDGMYPNSQFCFNCIDPCDKCSSASVCVTCLTDYFYNGQCYSAEDCPSGTYPNDAQMKCKLCPTGCTQCENGTYCTNCNTAIYVFYDFACITQCPQGTYKSVSTCLDCLSPCLTCTGTQTNCLSCEAPLLYFQNQCVDTCPPGTYEDINQCTACPTACETCSDASTCQSCSADLFYHGTACVAVCPTGFYEDTLTSTCEACSPPCSDCSGTAANCTQCIYPQIQYMNTCLDKCPQSYFEVAGSCKTCQNCVRCLDAYTCLQCLPAFYEYNGVCYTTCPSSAPIIDQSTNTCGTCNQECMNCQGTAKNCTQCYSGTYLYKGSCLVQCPLGFIEDPTTGTCLEPLIGNIIYFPFSFAFLFFFIVCIVSKCLFKETETITALAATVSLCQFGSWVLLTYILTQDYALDEMYISIGLYVGLAVICLSLGIGIAYNISFCKQYDSDKGWITWREHDKSCLYANRVVFGFSLITFRFFRILYSRLFNRTYLSLYIANGGQFLSTKTKLTITTIALMTLPMLGFSGFLLYKKQIYDQTFFCSIDTLFLGFVAAVLLTIDSFTKSEDFFENIKNSLPFLKYRNMLNDQSFHESLLSRDDLLEDPKRRTKSQICDDKEKEEIFRKITFIDNNKFGHLNVLDDKKDDDTHSLPEYNQLHKHGQFDPYYKSDADRVVDDLFFLDDEKRRLQEEELERQRLEKLRQEEQEQRRRRQEQERRRKLMQEDEQERVNLQFPDLVAIDKVQGKDKNDKSRKNPLELLSKSKKMDDRPVNDKALKKLEQMGKKNGIDPNFMKETFGVQKNHNPELLNQIIDKHHHVKRQSVKQLFNEENNQELLQELFNKNSKMDPEKLRELMNDPEANILLTNLANKENGRISPEMAKQLLDKDSKYNKEFIKNLLGEENGMDHSKLQTLLKDAKGKGKDSPLKALKKLGGQNLQDKQLLNNMLGEQSKLNPEIFTKVANDLSAKAIENLFRNKSEKSDLITQKILNNKKINLKGLTPILEDEELLEELANALGKDDPNLQQNLINLFKNAEDIDPQKLKQMLADPVIRKKLLGNPVDPEFLTSILGKESNTDFKLLSKTLLEMPNQVIEQTFKFDPQKNIDFKNVASLFDHNPKTDPKLVSKMLEPDMVKQLYYKGNDTKMLNKLVQKGNQFDPEVIKGVYGKQKNQFFDTHTDNLMSIDEKFQNKIGNDGNFRGQKDFSLGFEKHKSQVNMSRTAGGMMNFLTPIIPRNNTNLTNIKTRRQRKSDDEWSSDVGEEEEEIDDDGEIRDEDFRGISKRKKKMRKIKKKANDIRLPAEQIYLQRIQAPHEHAVRKASIRKKKKKVNNPGVMDEDNDVFDMDF